MDAPTRVRKARDLAEAIDIVRFALLIPAMYVHFGIGETGFHDQFLDFRKRPHAAVVGEGLIHAGAVFEPKVDVT